MSTAETSETTTNEETTTETAEVSTSAGVGGIVGETFVTSFDGLLDVLLQQRNTLAKSNQSNADLFNRLQEFINEKTTGVTQVDGAISALSGFVTDETPEDDKHVVELNRLQSEREELLKELKNADQQRRNIFSTITMTEGALQVLKQVLSKTGHSETETETE